MARKHSGGSHRSKAHRLPKFDVKCKGCGAVQVLNLRPPAGVDLYCLACSAARRKATAAPAVP